jgi:TonB-linked SusC/RagA family outer membrane protein
MFFASDLFAQTSVVRGAVTDLNGEAIIGVNILVKGTTNGVITDISGNYTLSNVRPNDVIVFSYIGFVTQEIRYSGQGTINLTMSENVELLDEVVVIGYGTLTRRELSSSIVQVNRENFLQGAVNNPMEMLQGRVAGLSVNLTSPANPNASIDDVLQIRGAGSLRASNAPLIIVDGMLGASYEALSPQDIESVTVLKDAGSAAIYGTRGANGVIIITTKSGSREGQTRITYDSWVGMNYFKDPPRVLTAAEFREKGRLGPTADMGYSTDWWDLMMRNGPSIDNNQYLSIDGGTRNGSYGLSLNYRNATGADPISEREEYGGRLQVQQRFLNNLLEVNSSLAYRRTTQIRANTGWGRALTINPTMPVYNEDGSFYQPTDVTNASQPYAELMSRDIRRENNRMQFFGEAKFHVFRQANQSLNLGFNYSVDFNIEDRYEYRNSQSSDSFWNAQRGGNAFRENRRNWTNRAELLATYHLNLMDDHDFRVVAGYSYDEFNFEMFNAQNYDFAFDRFLWNNLSSGTYLAAGNASMSSDKNLSKLIGAFGRINYNYKNLLIASASYRREGSTKFGEGRKWGDFYAGSLAFEMTRLSFMDEYSFINTLKPRISYGVTGRSDFEPYQAMQTYEYSTSSGRQTRVYYMDGEWVRGFRPAVNANPLLGWEKAIITNVGIDVSLYNRLRVSFEYYNRESRDLLWRYTAPQPPFLHNQILVNVGSIRNKGVEFTIDGDILKDTPLKWTSGIVAGTSKTHLTKLSSDIYQLAFISLASTGGTGSSDHHFRVMEGGMIGEFWALEWTGNIDEAGNMYVYNADGEEILMSAARSSDKRHLGKTGAPKLDLSWNNSFRYGSFDLNIFWRGAFGHYIYNGMKSSMGLEGVGNTNILLSAYDTKLKHPGGLTSSYFLEKGDYFKLDNITLGYNFRPRPNNYLENLRFYVTARNIATITGYTGNDPSIVRITGLEPGIDNSGVYPQALSITFGLTMRLK